MQSHFGQKGRWVGRLDLGTDGSGKRRRTQVNGRTKAEVRDRLRERQDRQRRGLTVGQGHVTVEDFLSRWLRDVLPVRGTVKSSNTIDNYRWAVDRWIVPTLGKHRLRELTPEDVEAMLRAMVEENDRAKNSVGRVRSVLAMALRHAQRRDMVARNAAELAEIPVDARAPKGGALADGRRGRKAAASR